MQEGKEDITPVSRYRGKGTDTPPYRDTCKEAVKIGEAETQRNAKRHRETQHVRPAQTGPVRPTDTRRDGQGKSARDPDPPRVQELYTGGGEKWGQHRRCPTQPLTKTAPPPPGPDVALAPEPPSPVFGPAPSRPARATAAPC